MMDLVLRTSAVLAGAWIASRLLGRASAATRHLLWHSALVVVVLAPVVSPLVPRYGLPGLGAASTALEHGFAARLSMRQDRSTIAPAQAPAATFDDSSEIPGPPTLSSLARAVWTCGSPALASWFVMGWILAARTARRSAAAPPAWQLEANDIAARMRIDREIGLGVLARDTSPLTVGLFRPRVLLPPAAASWTPDRRRAVLCHELAHVRRNDARIQVLTQVACTLYWFNPLIWMAAAALRRERERACDDDVLRHGATPSAYAACLLDVARLVEHGRRPSAALAMARSSELEGRLLAVLADRPRRPARATRAFVPLVTLACAVAALGAAPMHDRPAPGATTPSAAAWSPISAEPPEAVTGSVDALVAALADSSPGVREKAALALALQSGPEVVEPLIRALADTDSQVREKAAMGLALRRDPRSVEPLLAAMADPDSQVREKAALALGTTGDRRARAALEAATNDPDSQVREKAVAGLSYLNVGDWVNGRLIR